MSKGIDRRLIDVRLTVEGIANNLPDGITPFKGMQYIVGIAPTGAFAGGAKDSIAVYDGADWKFFLPKTEHFEVFDKSDQSLKRYNGSNFVKIMDMGQYAKTADLNSSLSQYVPLNALDTKVGQAGYLKTANIETTLIKSGLADFYEWHTLTAEEVEAKNFQLEHPVLEGWQNKVAVSVGGVVQVPNVDFEITTTEHSVQVSAISMMDIYTPDRISWAGKGLSDIELVAGDVFFIVYRRTKDFDPNDYPYDHSYDPIW